MHPKPLYGVATACKERYGTLRNFLVSNGGEADLLDRSVGCWSGESFNYGFGGGFRVECFGVG